MLAKSSAARSNQHFFYSFSIQNDDEQYRHYINTYEDDAPQTTSSLESCLGTVEMCIFLLLSIALEIKNKIIILHLGHILDIILSGCCAVYLCRDSSLPCRSVWNSRDNQLK